MSPKLVVSSEIDLTEIRREDRALYVEYMQDREIYENTLLIPFPYTLEHADEWISLNEQKLKEELIVTQFAIRSKKGVLMGGAGFADLEIGKSHKSEIGYWLAKRFWNQGIMTKVVKKLVTLGLEEFGLKRITATTFVDNIASQICLAKNHFVLEGQLKNYYCKDGKLIDAKLYSIFPLS